MLITKYNRSFFVFVAMILLLTGCVSKRKYEDALQAQRRSDGKNRQLTTQIDALREAKETVEQRVRRLERDNRILIEDTAIAAQRFAKYLRINNELNSKIGDISSATARLNALHATERTALENDINQKNIEITNLKLQLNALNVRFDAYEDSILVVVENLSKRVVIDTASTPK